MIFFYLLISVMPLVRHPLWARFWGELTMIKYVGAACLLYALFYLVTRRKMPSFLGTRQARWFLIFYVIAMVSYFTKGKDPALELSPFMSLTSFLILFFVTLSVVDSWRRFRWSILVAVGSIAFASLFVVREWQQFHTVYSNFRPGWVVGDANYFTISALLCSPLAFYLAWGRGPRWERLFCMGCLTVTLVAVMLAASRGGLLGLLAAFLFVVWNSRQRLRNLGLITAMLVPVVLLAPSSPLRRFLNPSYSDQRSTERRISLYKAGLRMASDNPGLGVGLGNFKMKVNEYAGTNERLRRLAHNSYIEIAAEMGFPGLFAFLAVLFWSFHSLGRVRRRNLRSGPRLLREATLGIQAGLLGCSVSIFFVSAQYQKLLWLMVFLSMCVPSLAAKARRKAGELSEPSEGPGPEPQSEKLPSAGE